MEVGNLHDIVHIRPTRLAQNEPDESKGRLLRGMDSVGYGTESWGILLMIHRLTLS